MSTRASLLWTLCLLLPLTAACESVESPSLAPTARHLNRLGREIDEKSCLVLAGQLRIGRSQ